MNEDVELAPGTLDTIGAYMDKHPEIGLLDKLHARLQAFNLTNHGVEPSILTIKNRGDVNLL